MATYRIMLDVHVPAEDDTQSIESVIDAVIPESVIQRCHAVGAISEGGMAIVKNRDGMLVSAPFKDLRRGFTLMEIALSAAR